MKKIVGLIWEKTPHFLRLRIIHATQQKFTVSVAAIITNERGEVLLLKHVLRPFSSWGIPGGFIEAGEQPADGIRRELLEETGLELSFAEIIRVRTVKRHIEILFRARATGKGEVKSREISDLGWYEIGKMPEGMSRIQKMLIEEVLSAEV
ncbi:MAG TPA: NUDIX domain-containing protein [Pyrinomonadaceae bacterium]|jgi:ADP-ribose pyrophosphatase YjhB (NUDIX family)